SIPWRASCSGPLCCCSLFRCARWESDGRGGMPDAGLAGIQIRRKDAKTGKEGKRRRTEQKELEASCTSPSGVDVRPAHSSFLKKETLRPHTRRTRLSLMELRPL